MKEVQLNTVYKSKSQDVHFKIVEMHPNQLVPMATGEVITSNVPGYITLGERVRFYMNGQIADHNFPGTFDLDTENPIDHV